MRIGASAFLIILLLAVPISLFVLATQATYAQERNSKPTEKSKTTCPVQGRQTVPADYSKLGSDLLVYLVLAVVLEMALTVIFNWRWFLKYAESKGLKTPIAILLGLSIALYYQLDVMSDVLNAMGMLTCEAQDVNASPTQWPVSHVGQVVTAFLLAGGSDAFFRLFTKLGIRNPFERKAEVLA